MCVAYFYVLCMVHVFCDVPSPIQQCECCQNQCSEVQSSVGLHLWVCSSFLGLVYCWSYNNVVPLESPTKGRASWRAHPDHLQCACMHACWAYTNVASLAALNGSTLWNVVFANNRAPPAAPIPNSCGMLGLITTWHLWPR